MDPPSGLRFRHTLHTVPAAFKFQAAEDMISPDHENNLFKSAQPCGVSLDDLVFPSLFFRETYIHIVKVSREKRGFVAACPGSDLHEYVFFVIGV